MAAASFGREPQPSLHTGIPELREQVEERKSAGLGDENNPQRTSHWEPWEEPESLMELDSAWRRLSRTKQAVTWDSGHYLPHSCQSLSYRLRLQLPAEALRTLFLRLRTLRCCVDQVLLNIPGCTCGVPNVSMATSGRTCSTKTTEVNFPHTIENSYSQQEETKPNFRASKNRLLLSQVAYFQNYQLKTYKDRKDHDKEQKYRESKNKLLMSQVAYYLACRLKMKVPGFLCCAPNVNMVASGRSPSRKSTEVNIPEVNEQSCSQQEENQLNVGANKNRLIMRQVAYLLNYRLKIYGKFYRLTTTKVINDVLCCLE
ncbi:uncharacterized protein LOC108316512 [Cebus imitator]|uniref:uncharacterized protein LOC108316512 n=1 Tax=Cebus imitator TaxID=2715852 RepID=UPI001899CFC7|nr:uncharacterized protein LOC108316512 [Cebus imitator]